MVTINPVLERLLHSDEPTVRFKTLARVLRVPDGAPVLQETQAAIQTSPRVCRLLAHWGHDGAPPAHPYAKWVGAHWLLSTLAELEYPPGDDTLIPLREQELDWLLGVRHQRGIRVINSRVRRCASQEGNAIYALLKLGLADERVDELAARLRHWQWPDGGWNCDKRPGAIHSSFMESLIPLRALALHAQATGNWHSQAATERAAQIFLDRRLYKRRRDGAVIDPDFVALHYPCYWHYDVLFGLKVMAEAGFVHDPRCVDALDLLEAKELPDGGWPAEKKYYRVTDRPISGRSPVDWGGAHPHAMNEFVSVDALTVLRAAGRL